MNFQLIKFSSETAERNSTELDRSMISTFSTKIVFYGSIKQDGRPALRLTGTLSTSPLKPLNEIQRNLTGSKISTSSTKFVFFWPIGKQYGSPGLWFAETFSTSPLNPLKGIQRNLTGSKISMSSTKFGCFGPIGKQDGRPGLWLAETFSTFPLKQLNGIQPNLTGSKISTSSTKFWCFGPIRKTRWLPWPLIVWDIFDISETTERNSRKLDRKQDLNVLYQVLFFRPISEQKCPPLRILVFEKRWHIVLRSTICGPLGLLFFFFFLPCFNH